MITRKEEPEFWTADEDGYMVLDSDDYIFRSPPSDRIIGYVRCAKCCNRIQYTEWDDPDEVIKNHC